MHKKKQFWVIVILSLIIVVAMAFILDNPKKDKYAISKLPFKINESGSYYLVHDLKISGSDENAIEISSDNVDIDLRGHKITGPTGTEIKNFGISALDRTGISVKNGMITGFAWGIHIYNNIINDRNNSHKSDVSIENLVVEKSSFRGIEVQGDHATVRNSVVREIGGSTIYGNSIGIYIQGKDCLVQNNSVVNVIPFGITEGVGIATLSPQNNCLISDNYIMNSKKPADGRTFAFWLDYIDGKVTVRNNFVYNTTYAYWHGGIDDPGLYINNQFISIDCSPKNLNDYYNLDRAENKNLWLNEKAICSDSAGNFTDKSFQNDGRSQYRLADIYYHNIQNFGLAETLEAKRVRLILAAKLYDSAMNNGLTSYEKTIAVYYRDALLKQIKEYET